MTTAARSRGRDGKTYPAHQPSQAERLHVAGRVHKLRCVDGWSLEGVRAVLAEEGVTRSVGAIVSDLRRWHCEACHRPPSRQPPPEPGAPGAGWAGPAW